MHFYSKHMMIGEFEKFIEKATAEEAAGQILNLGFDGAKYTSSLGSWFKKIKPGGVTLFRGNLENKEQAKTLIGDLKKLSEDVTGLPLLVCIDQEGGRVSRLPKDFVAYPTARSLGEDGSHDKVFEVYQNIGKTLREIGVNVNFAPVLDLNTNKDNPIIGDRSFGADPEKVTELGRGAIRALKKEGVLACAKHFPGHGNTKIDSHFDLPIDDRTKSRFEEAELRPFEMAIEEEVDFIMTAHVKYPAFDEKYPATLSRKVVTGLLRYQLGYSGVIVADDLDMKAITDTWSDDEAVELAIGAGVDMILVCRQGNRQQNAFEKIRWMIDGQKTATDEIKMRLGRILKAKSVVLNNEYLQNR